jgi:hypothetical protein
MYGWGPYADRVWKVCGVLIRFFPTGCTSIQITVSLRYEYRLFMSVINIDNLMNLVSLNEFMLCCLNIHNCSQALV